MTFAKLLLSQGKELLSSAEPPLEDETARTACTSLKVSMILVIVSMLNYLWSIY